MAYGKKNVIRIDPFSYNLGLIGEGGVGKTSTIFDMCRNHLGEDEYLFVECGKEEGADALSGIPYINCPDWNSEYDELTNSVGFKLLLEDIIENKNEEYPHLRVLVIDTFDQLREIVAPEVVRLHNKQHPDKRVTSIKAAFGGYMAGDDMADDMVLNALWELKKVGVQFITIGHVKLREITDPVTNQTYTQLTTDMSMRTFTKLKTKLHFLGVAYVDREIVQEQRGKKKDANVIKSEARKITFRDDNFAMDSKSRFAEITDDCILDGEALYKTLCDAIEKEATKDGGDIKKLKKEQDAINKAKAEKASEYSKNAKENKIDEEKNEELKDVIQTKFSELDKDQKAAFKQECEKLGIASLKDVSIIPTKSLQSLADFLSA